MAQTREQRRSQRRMAIVTALSLLVHVCVFALIGLNTPGVRERPPLPEEIIDISLLPPRAEPRQPAPARAGGPPASGIPRRNTAAPLLHVPAVEPPSEVAPSPLPAPSPSPSGATAGGDRKGGSGRATTIFPSPGEDSRKALRGTYGCAYPDAAGLTRREREACFDRPGKSVDPIAAPISGAKRKAWDQVAAKQERDRKWRETPTIPGADPEVSPLKIPF